MTQVRAVSAPVPSLTGTDVGASIGAMGTVTTRARKLVRHISSHFTRTVISDVLL